MRELWASVNDATRVLEGAKFIWHQRFELAPGHFTPGANDIGFLLNLAGLPEDLTGKSVLDIGTTNGAGAFSLERRGAERVVAVDLVDDEWFGFRELAGVLGSRAEFLQCSVYELPGILDEEFDVVLFWGVLYHLRHPLLALDGLRSLTRALLSIETAVSDADPATDATQPLARFHRTDDLGRDPSNWFTPTIVALDEWVRSSGFEPQSVSAWPADQPARAMILARASDGDPEYVRISYEQPLRVAAVRGREAVQGHD